MPKALLSLFLAALALLLGCGGPESLSDPTLGALTISFEAPVEKSADGARAITGVSAVQVKMTSEEYPPILASGAYPGSVTVDGVKAGTWLAQVYLNDASGATEYYGESTVVVQPGATTTATIRVYAMGSVAVGISEGVVAPTFTVGTVDPVALTVGVTINLPYATSTGARIQYTTNGVTPAYNVGTTDYNETVPLSISLSTVLKAVTVLTDNTESPVAAYSYSHPIIAVKRGATSYTSGSSTCDLGAVTPGGTGSPVYITVGNTGGATLELTGVRVELTGTSPESFDYDLGDLQPSIGAGQSTRFSLTFSPTAAVAYAATLKIYSNSAVSPAFSIALTGEGNNAPTLSFLTGLEVQGAGYSLANGRYTEYASSNTYPVYKHVTNGVYIYYETTGAMYTYYRYLIGNSATYEADDYDVGDSRMYQKSYGTKADPIGERYYGDSYDDQWNSYSVTYDLAPYVSSINGIGGWARLGLTLTAYYQYQDDESDAQGVTTFQWYRADGSSGPWTAISGATLQTYLLTGSDTGKYVSVGVTPVASDGALTGTMQRSTGLLINQ